GAGVAAVTVEHRRMNQRIADGEAVLQDAARNLPADAQRLLDNLPRRLAPVTKFLSDVRAGAVKAESPRAFAESLPPAMRRYRASGLQHASDAFNLCRTERALLDDKRVVAYQFRAEDVKDGSRVLKDLLNALARTDVKARLEAVSGDLSPARLRDALAAR